MQAINSGIVPASEGKPEGSNGSPVGLASRVIPSLYARGLRLISFKNPDFVRVNHPRKLLKLPHPIELFLQFYRALLPSELVFGR
jgi:hypothetical protein